jgi:transglutaminase superfamily protein
LSEPSRLSRVRSVISGPGELLLAFRMLFWAALLPALKRMLPLPRLVALMAPSHRHRPAEERSDTVVTLARWTYRTGALRDNCLERSLLTYRYLPAGNENSWLVLGVRRGEDGPPGHAWMIVRGVAVHDTDATLNGLVPVLAFDLDGNRCPVPKGVSPAPPAAPA